MLEIRSLESDLIVSVCKSMPQTLRCDLLGRLTACLEPDALRYVDTAESQGEHLFETLHFSWYNRHCMRVGFYSLFLVHTVGADQSLRQGQDAPADVPPVMLRRTGGIKTSYHQLLPYPSKDMTASGASSVYLSVKSILGALFEWLEGKVRVLIRADIFFIHFDQ